MEEKIARSIWGHPKESWLPLRGREELGGLTKAGIPLKIREKSRRDKTSLVINRQWLQNWGEGSLWTGAVWQLRVEGEVRRARRVLWTLICGYVPYGYVPRYMSTERYIFPLPEGHFSAQRNSSHSLWGVLSTWLWLTHQQSYCLHSQLPAQLSPRQSSWT